MPVFSYDVWYDSPRGGFALDAQQLLLRRMIAGWPRRGHNLLELFCASGRFLESFWEAGFDVTGQEQNQELALLARKRLGRRVDISLNNPEQLPFEDHSFDYVVCLNGLEFAENPAAVLREAGRLASRGLLVGFPNAWSLRGICARMGQRNAASTIQNAPVAPGQSTLEASINSALAAPGRGTPTALDAHQAGDRSAAEFGLERNLSPLRVCKLIRQLDIPGRFSCGSILIGPAATWSPGRMRSAANLFRLPVPLGACMMLRFDFAPTCAGTPLILEALSQKERPVKAAMARVSRSRIM
ncbi:MAG: class I SAM-dependent methyltransferase [Deltaproteobacteria bacterium]|nr:class I SAM-dependent methyltransferase [Deltaproteobacteria bacterium]